MANVSASNLHLVEKIELENGFQQWRLESETPLDLKPGCSVVLDHLKLPVLWQMGTNSFLCLCLNHAETIDKTHWQNGYFSNSSRHQSENKHPQDLTLILCKNLGLYHALHQIYNWRQLNQLPANLLLLSEIEQKLPFKLQPSRIFSTLVPNEATATIALLDDWGVAARFSSKQWQPGCFEGSLQQLEQFATTTQTNSIDKIYFA